MLASRKQKGRAKPAADHAEHAPGSLDGKSKPKPNSDWQSLALRTAAIQPKLTVSQPGDSQEQEADRIADRMMGMPIVPGSRDELSLSGDTAANVQRKGDESEEVEETGRQRKEQGAHDDAPKATPPIVHEALSSAAQPLDPSTRKFMEPRFGSDFSQVRVHADERAAESASAIDARAFTVNDDIVFGAGEYNPQTESGRRLLGHELTHVMQQRKGVQLNNRISEAGDYHEEQADAVAQNVMNENSDRNLIGSNPQHLGPPITAADAGGSAVQRQPADELFDTTAATAVKDKWAKEGASSESDIARQLDTYKKWHDAYNKAVKVAKKAKPRVLTDDQLDTVATWAGTYETHEQWKAVGAGKEPADPGTAPKDLAQLGGNPPTPAYEKIKKYEVTVPGASKYSYADHVKSANTVRDIGVGDVGTVGGKDKIGDVFDKAGVSAPDTAMVKKAFSVLSSLEGKFDAINTYDAGYISAGFIQFISGSGGNDSLAKVLRTMKSKNPSDFTTRFHNLGIDVDANGFVVVDPADGSVLHGADAVQKIISDKRLTAAFQEAGKSDAFQQAQARIAYEQYYVPDKSFTLALTVKDTDPAAKKKTKTVTVSGKYSDVLLSEAGKVAIVDRGVQHGTGGKHKSGGAAGRFLDACQEVVDKHDLTNPTAADLAKYESEIVPRLVNRYAVSSDATLTQPAAAPTTAPKKE